MKGAVHYYRECIARRKSVRGLSIRHVAEQYIVSCDQRSIEGVDNIPTTERSEIMSRVRAKDTRPEMLVRRLVFAQGYRYRLHDRKLPGCPDLVFKNRSKVIFVHGCFWHQHAKCALSRMPKSRLDFWEPKLISNKERDARNKKLLVREGWKVLTIWECQLKEMDRLKRRIRRFLDA